MQILEVDRSGTNLLVAGDERPLYVDEFLSLV